MPISFFIFATAVDSSRALPTQRAALPLSEITAGFSDRAPTTPT
ncbi:hypothetical protein [Cylindrospermum stagnale]|nr:hypothetical protein [Cylindrospermum stagnale]